MSMQPDPPPLACDAGAIPEEEWPVHRARTRRLFGQGVVERERVADGYVFMFPPEEIEELGRFVALERRCCPFLEFSLDVPARGDPVWLVITGPSGTQPFLEGELVG